MRETFIVEGYDNDCTQYTHTRGIAWEIAKSGRRTVYTTQNIK